MKPKEGILGDTKVGTGNGTQHSSRQQKTPFGGKRGLVVGPRGFARLPAIESLRKQGVEVIDCRPDVLDTAERETAVSYTLADKYAEVTTSELRWIKRLLALKCVPATVNVLKNTQIWHFTRVPRSAMPLPVQRSKKKEE